MRIEWNPSQAPRFSGSAAAPTGLLATLRGIEVGQKVLAVGLRTADVHNHMRAARRGSARWYEARTVTTGVEIRRTE
jgi:hypothetical protein